MRRQPAHALAASPRHGESRRSPACDGLSPTNSFADQPAHARHLHIGDQTFGIRQATGLCKRLAGCESRCRVTEGSMSEFADSRKDLSSSTIEIIGATSRVTTLSHLEYCRTCASVSSPQYLSVILTNLISLSNQSSHGWRAALWASGQARLVNAELGAVTSSNSHILGLAAGRSRGGQTLKQRRAPSPLIGSEVAGEPHL